MLNRTGRKLVKALRAELPEGFKWDFYLPYEKTACGSVGCAIGLALETGIIRGDNPGTVGLGDAIGLSGCGVELFGCSHNRAGVCPTYGVPRQQVTPAMVADAIERIAKDYAK